MVIELAIAGITGSNRREKLIAAAYALSDQMGLDAEIEATWMEKAKTHKYISKEWENDHWKYRYKKGEKVNRANIASQLTDVMTGIKPLQVDELDEQDAKTVGAAYLQEIAQYLKDNDVHCRWLQKRKVIGVDMEHLTYKFGRPRPIINLKEHTKYLPFVLPVIEKYGHVRTSRLDKKGRRSYELVGKAILDDEKEKDKEEKDEEYVVISVILREYEPRKGLEVEHRSVFGFTKKLVKSLATAGGQRQAGHESPLSLPTASRHIIGKAALPKDRLPLIISDISVRSIENYSDIEISIQNITSQNRKAKFAKAVRAAAAHLKVPVSIARKGAGDSRAGEPYMYPVQQELSDQWAEYYWGITRKIYKAVIEALGLPPVEVETMRKAQGESDNLRYHGKVIYNPETGKPLKVKDFNALAGAIEKFLNRNTKDAAKRIVLDSVALEKLKRRMAKYQSTADLKRLSMDSLKYRGKTFDWIRSDIKNLSNVLGQPLSGSEMARYQVAQDYVAHLVTRSNQKIRDDIRETVLNGIIEKRSKGQVSQDLFNRLGRLNRDWKRIADTEIVNTSNLAGILQEVNDTPKGEKAYFKRYELPGCCDKCKKVNEVIALWSDTPLGDENIKDPYAHVAIWEGKGPDKGLPVGTVHPNCRGGWLRWGGQQADAMTAQLRGRAEKWDAAAGQAREEYREKGIKNPNDQTPGYVDRINEIYREKLGDIMEKAYNPNQPRNALGWWSPDTGGLGGGTPLPYNSSTEKARELKAEDWGTPEEIAEMAKMERTAKNRYEARKILEDIAKDNEENGPMTSRCGIKARIPRNNIGKLVSSNAIITSYDELAHYHATANIDKLFRNALKIWDFEKDPNKNNEGLKTRYYLYSPMEYGGKIIPIKLTVKEYDKEEIKNKLYSIEAIDVEFGKMEKGGMLGTLTIGVPCTTSALIRPSKASPTEKDFGTFFNPSPNISLAHLFDSVNDYFGSCESRHDSIV